MIHTPNASDFSEAFFCAAAGRPANACAGASLLVISPTRSVSAASRRRHFVRRCDTNRYCLALLGIVLAVKLSSIAVGAAIGRPPLGTLRTSASLCPLGWYRISTVIVSQCAHWRDNPFSLVSRHVSNRETPKGVGRLPVFQTRIVRGHWPQPFPRGEGGSPTGETDEERRKVMETTHQNTAHRPPKTETRLPPLGGGARCAHWAERAFARGNRYRAGTGQERLLLHQARIACRRWRPLSVTAYAVPALPEGEPSCAQFRFCGKSGRPPLRAQERNRADREVTNSNALAHALAGGPAATGRGISPPPLCIHCARRGGMAWRNNCPTSYSWMGGGI